MMMIYLVLALTAPAPQAPKPEDVEREVKRLASPDLAVRVEAMVKLEIMGPAVIPIVERLRESIGDRDGARERIDKALRRLRALSIRQELAERAGTGLVFAGQYKDLAKMPEAAALLLETVADARNTLGLRDAAANALCDLADPATLPAVRTLFEDPLTEDRLVESLAFVAAELGDDALIRRREGVVREELARAKTDSERVGAHRSLARLLYRRKKYEEAIPQYDAIIKLFRDKIESLAHPPAEMRAELSIHYYNAACTAGLLKRYDDAVKYLRLAQETDPGSTAGLLENLQNDGDLEGLRGDERGKALLKEWRALVPRGSRPRRR